ncbi:MAG: hypothetical protein ACXVCY_03035 [Pseudobdellovibrionaceae bacterium]
MKIIKMLFIFSLCSLLSVVTFAETKEEIFDVNEIKSNNLLRQFQTLEVLMPYQKSVINLNPLASIYKTESEETFNDGSPLNENKNGIVESIYVGVRTLTTQIPVQVFESAAFKKASVQTELFKDVSFSSCGVDHCFAQQMTELGRAHYEMIYKFLSSSELAQIHMPDALLRRAEFKDVKFALVQNAFNWNNFFSSGFNLILIKEDAQKNAQIIAYQVFLLSPHSLPDWGYLLKISMTLDSQIKSFNSALDEYKKVWMESQEIKK